MYNEDYKLRRLLQNFAPKLFDFFTHKSRYSDQQFILKPFKLFFLTYFLTLLWQIFLNSSAKLKISRYFKTRILAFQFNEFCRNLTPILHQPILPYNKV